MDQWLSGRLADVAECQSAVERNAEAQKVAEEARGKGMAGVDKLAVLKDAARISTALAEAAADAGIMALRGRIVPSWGEAEWCQENAELCLSLHPDWKGVFAHDLFAGKVVVKKSPEGMSGFEPGELNELHITRVVRWFNRFRFPKATKTIAHDAITAVASLNKFHPIRDYLESLEWDGTERLSGMFGTYFGAEHDLFLAGVGRKWMIAAVARVMRPGCKADNMVVLEGAQGTMKSSALAVLAGSQWFGDHLPDIKSKDASAYLQGRWIIEKAELETVRKADVETVKAFLTRQEERYRPPYGRVPILQQRQCVFVGTTNRDDYITDETGGRRFWPVQCGEIKLEALTRDRDQLWAEAYARYSQGEKWWFSRTMEVFARSAQAGRTSVDPWDEMVSRYAEGKDVVYLSDVITLGVMVPKERQNRGTANRVGAILKRMGYKNVGREKARGDDRDKIRYEK